MARLSVAALITALAPPTLAADDSSRPAYSLVDVWEQQWLLLGDRSSRADPDGPLLQRFDPRHDSEYDINLAIAEFRVRDELAWVRRDTGARLWVQSFDEFTLANRLQLKARAPMGSVASLGLALDRLQTWETNSNTARVFFAFDDIDDTGLSTRIGLHPRWEKDDSDVEAYLGYETDDFGEARLQVFAFDPFLNASTALAESRDKQLDATVKQLEPTLALALRLASIRRKGVRGELYLGRLFPASTRYRFAEPTDEPDHDRTPSAWMYGGLLEWQSIEKPIVAGVAMMRTEATTRFDFTDPAAIDLDVDEWTRNVQLYLLADPVKTLTIDTSVRFLSRPERDSASSHDWSTLSQVLVTWMPLSDFGSEIGVVHHNRQSVGKPDARVAGIDNRLLTRVVLDLANTWWRFGVGWDLDPGDGIYDGGGLTMTADF